jgi:transposase-like protein
MARPVKQVLWDQWRRRIESQRASGRSIAEFCRTENISPQAFYTWRRKLRDATPDRNRSRNGVAAPQSRRRSGVVAARRLRRGARTRHAPPTRPAEFLQLPVTAAQSSPWIELTLADGTIVRIPQQNLAALVAVLRVLGGQRLEVAMAEGCHA